MGTVLRFPGHKWAHCIHEDCYGCMICAGLVSCLACGGAEASLPQECPGEWMTTPVCSVVQYGRADYRDGQWLMTTGQPWRTPSRRWRR